MPFFSRSKRTQAPAASSNQSILLHQPAIQETHSKTVIANHLQDPRKRRTLRSELKEIRLLCLQPGEGSDLLCCKLQHTSILSKRHLKYETVSYCWGKEPGKATITIEGISVAVTKSAVEVLHRVRDPRRVRTIWIDAICIDQTKDDRQAEQEKAEQVAFMSDVYRQGWSNVVWLGECGSEAEDVSRVVQQVISNMRHATHDFKDMSYIMYGPGTKNGDGRLLDTSIDLAPLMTLFSRPWFERLWVAQEATLSPKSVCHLSQATLLLSDVLLAAAWLTYNRQLVPAKLESLRGLAAARAMWYLQHIRPWDMKDLFMIYTLTRDFQASEDRDYVFALLSMYDVQRPHLQVQQRLLRPSYGRDGKLLEHVFRDATRAVIEDGQHLAILHFVDAYAALPGMPTWALRFDSRFVDDHHRVCRVSGFHATAGTLLQLIPCADENILALKGMTLGMVSQMSDIYPAEDGWSKGLHARFMEQVTAMIKAPGKDRSEELASTLMAGVNYKHEKVCRNDIEDFEAFRKHVKHYPKLAPGAQTSEKAYAGSSRWYQASKKAMLNGRFFLTEEGTSGVGPAIMLPRDRIVALFGGPALYLLRPVKARPGEYYLVGECYVHGHMYGDVVKDRIRGGFRGESFYIC